MSWVITGSEKTPVDPQFGSVSLLLHGNGTNGSTTITDSSSTPKTVTAVGNAQISTAQSKFGGASLWPNTGVFTIPASTAFEYGTQDYTIETWIYVNTVGPVQLILDQREAGTSLAPAIYTQAGLINYFLNGGIRIQSSLIALDSWIHLALSRASGSTRLFLNGTQSGSTYIDANNNSSSLVRIGRGFNNGDLFNGYIDDLRITKGVARYTANFTPPTAQFPDI